MGLNLIERVVISILSVASLFLCMANIVDLVNGMLLGILNIYLGTFIIGLLVIGIMFFSLLPVALLKDYFNKKGKK